MEVENKEGQSKNVNPERVIFRSQFQSLRQNYKALSEIIRYTRKLEDELYEDTSSNNPEARSEYAKQLYLRRKVVLSRRARGVHLLQAYIKGQDYRAVENKTKETTYKPLKHILWAGETLLGLDKDDLENEIEQWMAV